MGAYWRVFTRKKQNLSEHDSESRLGRVLNTLDLTALGIGSTLGVGVYVIAGHVAKESAGPAVVLSFLIAAVASAFAGLCYAEFGARVPKAGSAYIYSYVCVGEFIAFIIGWNLILEYVIGSASVARGLSLYLDTLVNDTLKTTFRDVAPIDVDYMSPYFDFLSFGVSLLLSIALAFGLKKSSMVNNVFTVLNLLVVAFVIIAGGTKSNADNWNLKDVPTNAGSGGFFPYGISGMIKGAATCFYGFVGFDSIATTGEEVKNPKKAIPISIIVTLLVVFLSYFGTSTVLTMMIPYYKQDPNAPLPHAFIAVGLDYAKWIVAIGAIFGLSASLFGSMFPLPRIIYAMANDGLIFKFLGIVSERFRTPVIGTLLAGLLTGIMSAIFDLKDLVNMMSIGTLLAYTMVAASVLLLRYSHYEPQITYNIVRTDSVSSSSSDWDDDLEYTPKNRFHEENFKRKEEMFLIGKDNNVTYGKAFKQILSCGCGKDPTYVSQKVIYIEIFMFCILALMFGLCLKFGWEEIEKGTMWAIILISIIGGLLLLIVLFMSTQPKSDQELSFKVPFVPLIPALSILVNIYLMLMLDANTWIRFGVWMIIGVAIYLYCISSTSSARNHSVTSTSPKGQQNNGFIPDGDKPEMQEVPKKNGVSNGVPYNFEDDSEYNRENDTKVTYFGSNNNITTEEPINILEKQNVTNYETQKSTQSVDERVAIGFLDEVINKQETEESASQNYARTPSIDDRKISVDAESLCSNNVHVIGSDFAVVHREDTPVLERELAETLPENKPQEEPVTFVERQTDVIHEEDEESTDVNDDQNTDEDMPETKESDLVDDEPNIQEVINNTVIEATSIPIPPKFPEELAPTPKEVFGIVLKARAPPPPIITPPVTPKDTHSSPVPPPPATPPLPPPPVPLRNPNKPNFVIAARKSKSTPSSPKPQHSPKLRHLVSQESLDDPQLEDHVKIGSKSHNVIATKLEKIFKQGNKRTTMGMTKPIPQNPEDAEVAPEEHPPEIAQKNTNVVKGFNRISEIMKTNTPEQPEEGVEEAAVLKPSDFKRKLNELMSVRASTIKPKKLPVQSASFEDAKVEEEPKKSEPAEQQMDRPEEELLKNVMGNVFKSIKLRKVDSFRTNEDTNDSNATNL